MTTPGMKAGRWPGRLITLDGPGGVGKSSTATALASLLTARGIAVTATCQPSHAALGALARHGTDTYRGMALACLCAADRHHQLATEILPALRAGVSVVCDRYLPSSLVLQGLDGIGADTIWALNCGVYRPDLAVILTADPTVLARRLRERGGHSRFERDPANTVREARLYRDALTQVRARGWPAHTVDATTATPDTVATTIADHLADLEPVCR
ncbi:hypothetical protein GCM10010174_03440 [Kutzneria viridogrisea]|uniref:Thymidylate kinase n=1 Tax=Kutzneria viridogrisea TaxID=47990 RepID=A0ABR6BRD7_9PSEU|nr:dTMP kinase [Kutzneria viridogrisea]